MKSTFKRYCKTLQLENDPQLIEEYKKLHAMGAAWPEVTAGAKEVGIINPRQSEWEATVSKFQKTSEDASADEKWQLIERIFKMDQSEEENMIEGYVQQIDI